MPKGTKGVSWHTIYTALRSERLPHEIREEETGMNLQEVKNLKEEEYLGLVNRVYQKTLKEEANHG